MFNKSNRCMAFALVSCLAFSNVSFAGVDLSSMTPSKVAWYSSLAVVAAMVYRLESKEGPCENVDYDFNTLMRGTDSYKAKLKKAAAWVDRYIIGQPYKSSKVKAKDGELVVTAAQEPLGLMGIAQSNIKPVAVGLGSAYFIDQALKGELAKNKIDDLGWVLAAAIFGLTYTK